MTPRIWSYGEPDDTEIPKDRLYESFGEQGLAMPDHTPSAPGPKNWRRSDERIGDEVCARLADDPWIDSRAIEVMVDDGEVTLSGSVENREQRHRAAELVETAFGVEHVVNRLRVAPSVAPRRR